MFFMKKVYTLLFIITIATFCNDNVFAQGRIRSKRKGKKEEKKEITVSELNTVSGEILDAKTKEPLVGVTVFIQGTNVGTLTDAQGKFSLEVPEYVLFPLTVCASFLEYEKQCSDLEKPTKNLKFSLKPRELSVEEIVISSSRIPESVREAPATVFKMTPMDLRLSPQLNAYEMASPYPGLMIVTPSIGFKVINARGFNQGTNERVVYISDGIDVQSSGLNVPIGLLNGVGDAEVLSTEYIQGPTSALYGANAFNGVYVIQTRDPFEYPGLNIQAKTGGNHLDGIDANPTPFYDVSLSYGKTFLKNKAAVRFSFTAFQIQDWYATDTTDIADYSTSVYKTPGTGNPGYDGMNIYGDEISIVATPEMFNRQNLVLVRAPYRVSRHGYAERYLMDYRLKTYRSSLLLSYKLSPTLRLNALVRTNLGNGIVQATSRIQAQDFITYQAKLELQGIPFVFRVYMNGEDAGKTYDSRFAAFYINRKAKPDANWIYQYVLAYSGAQEMGILNFLNSTLRQNGRDTIIPYNAYSARKFADSNNELFYPIFQAVVPDVAALILGKARYDENSDSFKIALNEAIATPINRGGATFIEKTKFYHADFQYEFQELDESWKVLVGASGRYFMPNSQGTYFIDTAGVNINYYEAGVFGLVKKYLWEKRLLLSASFRLDKPQNFDFQYNPRLAALYFFGEEKQHLVRAGFQTGYRVPTIEQQFANTFINASTTLAGGLQRVLEGNGIDNGNAYLANSVQAFQTEILRNGGDTLAAAKLLQKITLSPIKPEYINTFEFGYRGTFLESKIYFDVTVYYNRYSNLMSMQAIVGPAKYDVGTEREPLTYEDLLPDTTTGQTRTHTYFLWSSLENQKFHSVGVLPFIEYKFNDHFKLRASYSFEKLLEDQELLDSDVTQGFNTPLHRTSEALIIEKIKKRWNFQITHTWVDAFFFKGAFADKNIPAYNLVDAQISYVLPKQHLMFKLGGQNILNNRHIEIAGGPTIGALVYLQINFDPLIR